MAFESRAAVVRQGPTPAPFGHFDASTIEGPRPAWRPLGFGRKGTTSVSGLAQLRRAQGLTAQDVLKHIRGERSHDADGGMSERPVQAKDRPDVGHSPEDLGAGSGAKLPESVRPSVERAFATDFSDVRVHEGPAAESIGALAFTRGTDIHFAPGRYEPTSETGRRLLGHELAHVVQQREGRVRPTTQASGIAINDDPALEAQAERAGERVAAGEPVGDWPRAGASPEASAAGAVQRAIKTWDKEEKKWVSAHTDNEDALFSGVEELSDEGQIKRENALLQGDLSFEGIADTEVSVVSSIDPFGPLPRAVLQDTCESSWSEAKHVLAAGKLPDEVEERQDSPTRSEQKASLQAMMKKIWEYRQWHHEVILQRTQKRVEEQTSNEKGLTEWKAAGSTSLTSDIDVNLKGEETELAVTIFNDEFKADGWGFEAGVVYDVNVYALDFMHGMGEIKQIEKQAHRVASQEGGRSDRPEGGIENAELAAYDQALQEEWALVKLRIYMNNEEWAGYKASIDPDNAQASTWKRVEAKYEDYRWTLKDAMEEEVGGVLQTADDVTKTGYDQIQAQAKEKADSDTKAEDVAIAASNRVYEEKLGRVKELRTKLKTAVTAYDSAVKSGGLQSKDMLEQLKLTIDGLLVELREVISECALYSNEAYVTSGAVIHAVVGLQVGKEVELTKGASMNAVTENYADSLKEIGRHGGSLGEATFKSGKYLWRMADAARNIGLERVPGVTELYRVGYEAANTIKSMDDSADKEGLSAAQAQQHLGLSPSGGASPLKAKVMSIANAITVEYKKTVQQAGKAQELAKPTQKDKH